MSMLFMKDNDVETRKKAKDKIGILEIWFREFPTMIFIKLG